MERDARQISSHHSLRFLSHFSARLGREHRYEGMGRGRCGAH